MSISDSEVINRHREFLFGNGDLLGNKYMQADATPQDFIKDTVQKQSLLFSRAVLMRDMRHKLLANRRITDISKMENDFEWDGQYVLPPVNHNDPLYLDAVKDDAQRMSLGRLYLFDLLEQSASDSRYPTKKQTQALLILLECEFGAENMKSWQDEYNHNPDKAEHELARYQASITYANAIREIDANFVCMDVVKEQLRDLYNASLFSQDRLHKDEEHRYTSLHFALSADRGKGKSTIVPLIGKAMKKLGLLKKGHVINVTLNSIATHYLGGEETHLQEAFNKAKDGILFVDEADTLAEYVSKGQSRSRLVQAMNSLAEERRDNTCLIVAAYPDNMEKLLNNDQGFRSRFGDRILKLPDYETSDLLTMFELEMKRMNFTVDNDATRDAIWDFFSDIRKNKEKEFANGRTVRDFVQTMQSVLSQNYYAFNTINHITLADVQAAARKKQETSKPKTVNPYEEINPFKAASKALTLTTAEDNKVVTLAFKPVAAKPGQQNGPQ